MIEVFAQLPARAADLVGVPGLAVIAVAAGAVAGALLARAWQR